MFNKLLTVFIFIAVLFTCKGEDEPESFLKNGKVGLKDPSTGKIIAEAQFDNIPEFSEGLAAVKKNGKWGYINLQGKIVIKPQFDEAIFFSCGLAFVKNKNKSGFINKEGKWVIGPTEKISFHMCFSEGLVTFRYKERTPPHYGWGLMNTKGEIVSYPKFDGIRFFSEGVCVASEGDLYGFIDKKGEWIVEPKFKKLYNFFSEGVCAAQLDELWGYIDKKGAWVISPKFKSTRFFLEGLASAMSPENKWGYIDKKGNWAVKPQFDYCTPFNKHNMAAVTKNGKHLVIDRNGKIVADKFDKKGMCIIKQKNKYGIIAGGGDYLVPPVYEDIKEFSEALAAIKKNGKWGFVDLQGNIAIKFQYDEVKSFKDGKAEVKKGDAWFTIDKKGSPREN